MVVSMYQDEGTPDAHAIGNSENGHCKIDCVEGTDLSVVECGLPTLACCARC